jgi:hypothetical protein
MVPLDATNHVPWTERLLRRLSTLEARPARTVHDMAVSRESLDGFFLWDELAAVATVHREVVSIERRTVSIDDDGAVVGDPKGVGIDVAVDADAAAATNEFLQTLNGGDLPAIVPLTGPALDYMIAMNGADGRFGAAVNRVYTDLDRSDLDPRATAEAFVQSFFGAVDEYAREIQELIPPNPISTIHRQYLDVLLGVVGTKADMLAALAAADGADAGELLDHATSDASLPTLFERARDLCQEIEDYSFLHDGPRPCSAAADR